MNHPSHRRKSADYRNRYSGTEMEEKRYTSHILIEKSRLQLKVTETWRHESLFLHHELNELVVYQKPNVSMECGEEGGLTGAVGKPRGSPDLLERTVDTAITVLVSFTDHLVHLVVGQLLADGGHDMTQLSGGDETVVVAVEHLECLANLLL